jgi:pimeloyl-ACP methyl ester carboxylesterase
VELDRGGVAIHYDVTGTGRALLLSHGFGASSHMFGPNRAALGRDHTVITWDQRGHGASGAPADPAAYSVELAIDDMAALLDAVGADRAVVGGHSLGGYLSLAFYMARPERVEALILIDTGPGFRNPEARADWNRMAESYAADLERRGLAALGSSGELAADVHQSATGLVNAARRVLPQRDAAVLESLPTIGVPVLVLVGADDERFLAGAGYMAAKIPDATLAVVAGAGHAPNVTHAAEFDAHVLTFLDRLEVSR